MRNIFTDNKIEAEFRKNGYVTMPFISRKEVASLTQKFYETIAQSGGQITTDETGVSEGHEITYDFTFIDKNPEYKQRVFEIITQEFKPAMDKILDNYRPIIANYIRKKNESGEVPLHENWAFADERKCSTVSIWCPLIDSTVENGTLQVVPGSHKRFGEVRGPMIPWELDNIKKQIIENHLVPLQTKAGDCVILDDSIVHYSAVNKTNELRLAIQLICIPAEFPSIHYHMDSSINPDKVDVLEVDVDFYMKFNPWKKPEGEKVLRSIPYNHRLIDEKEFLQRMKAPRFDEQNFKSNLFSKLKGVFS